MFNTKFMFIRDNQVIAEAWSLYALAHMVSDIKSIPDEQKRNVRIVMNNSIMPTRYPIGEIQRKEENFKITLLEILDDWVHEYWEQEIDGQVIRFMV